MNSTKGKERSCIIRREKDVVKVSPEVVSRLVYSQFGSSMVPKESTTPLGNLVSTIRWSIGFKGRLERVIQRLVRKWAREYTSGERGAREQVKQGSPWQRWNIRAPIPALCRAMTSMGRVASRL
jgi:hypothetical protein